MKFTYPDGTLTDPAYTALVLAVAVILLALVLL
jgi:hypothetical protein